MATLTVQLVAICAGGDHATIRMTKDGQSKDLQMSVAELRGAMTQDDREGLAKGILRLAADGKTAAQTKTAWQSGITVTV